MTGKWTCTRTERKDMGNDGDRDKDRNEDMNVEMDKDRVRTGRGMGTRTWTEKGTMTGKLMRTGTRDRHEGKNRKGARTGTGTGMRTGTSLPCSVLQALLFFYWLCFYPVSSIRENLKLNASLICGVKCQSNF